MSVSVRLELPGDPDAAFAARVVASWMIARAGGDIAAIEDGRLAIDELLTPSLGGGHPVNVTYTFDEGAVCVSVDDGGVEMKLTRLAERILAVTTESLHLRNGTRSTTDLRLRTRPADPA